MAKVHCVIYYNRKAVSPHVRQIYTGFCELSRKKFISIEFIEHDWNPNHITENLVKVQVNTTTEIIYDTNDGLYWIYGTLGDNLKYLQEVILPQCDLLFKRSCSADLVSKLGSHNRKVYPLGLNYNVTSASNVMDKICYSRRGKLRRYIRSSPTLSSMLGMECNRLLYYENFEFPPAMLHDHSECKVLFLTRLWDPDDRVLERETSSMNELTKEERGRINEKRIECIEACKKKFKRRFIGGLVDDKYARKIAPHLIAPQSLTSKQGFINLIKSCPICVATTGLHNSIGWKFAEYIAASRAIITEKLNYILPGEFEVGQNYLEFSTAGELVRQIDFLSDNPVVINDMMWENYSYYNSYLRPDNLILNTLRIALS